ncbi:hypothetical protein [Pseudomonas nitroreducens]|uniref:hypothetical protein n=1 Tax=Pseudomonas nitroreducens TaxID=46680 RepID=UPI003CC82FC0
MKKAILMGVLLVAAMPVFAETVLFDPSEGRQYVGEEFDARSAKQVLYLDRPCKLPIVNAKDMREYTTTAIAIPMKACWGKLLGGEVVIVFENGMTRRSAESAFVVAEVDKKGNAKIVKSIYKRH